MQGSPSVVCSSSEHRAFATKDESPAFFSASAFTFFFREAISDEFGEGVKTITFGIFSFPEAGAWLWSIFLSMPHVLKRNRRSLVGGVHKSGFPVLFSSPETQVP